MSDEKEFTMEEYIDYMIKEGYRSSNDFAPLKCYDCDSSNLETYDECYEEHWVLVEYSVRCKDCKQHQATWAYGNWNL